ncbi:alpha/beta hydrolase [Flavobacterium sp. MFBS3-15]|uniref:alpha/beta fold hydrolase n=1 Tax=Flavobacterium sp. MFBS3-15 TaxID=2989816 RepID=UPI0022365267|nr:alpha/beta hydrolase [Flavobacterium sp. MFBS3-15]MCW4470440.1 alpha/beta hydrolase [Flavobacterium sp. MFBS3-15]
MKKFIYAGLTLILSFGGYAQTKKGYAPVNGLQLYYEIHGSGKPIVLLHGSFMTIGLNWDKLIPELSKTQQVIAIEMQGHGHTADIDRPYSFETLADDVSKLLKYLKIEKADILGYSLGGTVALEFGIKHPEQTGRLIIISSVYQHSGWLPEVNAAMKEFKPDFFDATPLKPAYEKVAPEPKNWRKFVSKLMEFDTEDFDIGQANLKAMKSPVLFIMGDNDGVDLNHTAEMYRLCGGGVFADMTGLPKSQLAILPGQTHVTLMMETEKIAYLINTFLNGQKANK